MGKNPYSDSIDTPKPFLIKAFFSFSKLNTSCTDATCVGAFLPVLPSWVTDQYCQQLADKTFESSLDISPSLSSSLQPSIPQINLGRSWLRKRLDGEGPCGLKYVSVDFDKKLDSRFFTTRCHVFGTVAQSTAIGSEAQHPSTQNDSLCTTWNSGCPHYWAWDTGRVGQSRTDHKMSLLPWILVHLWSIITPIEACHRFPHPPTELHCWWKRHFQNNKTEFSLIWSSKQETEFKRNLSRSMSP